MRTTLILIFIALLIQPLKAQGEGAVPFLTLQQSPLLFGAGSVGTAISSNHPFGFYYNPAQLGNSSRENNISIFFMPEESKWLERIVPNLTFQTGGVSVGYNFKTEEGGLPLSIGLGYLANKIGYGKFVVTGPDSPEPIGEYNPYEQFKSISIGASYDYYLLFNLGFSIKMYESKLGNHFVDNRIEESTATGTAFDLGLMVTTPITKLVFNDYKINS